MSCIRFVSWILALSVAAKATNDPTEDMEFYLTLGHSVTCAVETGSVKCWGNGVHGQLGLESASDLLQPQETPIDLGGDFAVSSVRCGGNACCALSFAGSIKCWGGSSYGGLGYGDTNWRGDSVGEMGDNLGTVDLGSDFVVQQVVTTGDYSCALSEDSEIKCWGRNNAGQLGQGHTTFLGDNANEMGDNLYPVDLGSDFEPILLEGPCAMSTQRKVKCWGWNWDGRLGLGDSDNRGDAVGEMGDNLPVLDFGDFNVSSIHCSATSCCVLSFEGSVKCWGANVYGQLGYGDTENRGDEPGEMGDSLPVLDLGADFVVETLSIGYISSCAQSTEGIIKCWGQNYFGQLGYGDTDNRGDHSGEMGDLLQPLNLGSVFSSGVRLAYSGQSNFHFCVFEESGDFLVKCWGRNNEGQLGYGDTANRGDLPGQMGNNLTFVDTGFTFSPTTAPTTVAPSAEPTAAPTPCDALETCARLDAVEDAVEGLQDAVDRLDALGQAVESLENTMAAMYALLATYGEDSG